MTMILNSGYSICTDVFQSYELSKLEKYTMNRDERCKICVEIHQYIGQKTWTNQCNLAPTSEGNNLAVAFSPGIFSRKYCLSSTEFEV